MSYGVAVVILAGAGVLAADAVGSAERAGAVQPLCEALEMLEALET